METSQSENLIIYTGTDFSQTFFLENDQSDSALNLTGYTGTAEIKRYQASSSVSANFIISFANDRTTGEVTLSLDSTVSGTIKAGKYYYNLLLTNSGGTKTRVIEGTAIVKKSVTR